MRPLLPGDKVGVMVGTDWEPLLEVYGDDPAGVITIAVPARCVNETAEAIGRFLGIASTNGSHPAADPAATSSGDRDGRAWGDTGVPVPADPANEAVA